MTNHWAITIGINQYRHLQPLMHAQNDALFTHRFLTEVAGIPSDHCALLSDLATSVGHQAVYPDKPAIAQWIQTITQQVAPDDVFWFFFSGYGTQVNGEDYLMPIDGDPGQIERTGIAIADVIETLAQLPTNKGLLILDINRSQGALSGQSIGTQVIDLAQNYQISTFLSCQPEQYSHETLGVRHGLFTAALLEALQQDCVTPSQIQDYLTKRLPELCEHHWRPIQNPVSLIPDEAKLAVVVPHHGAGQVSQQLPSDSALVTGVAAGVVAGVAAGSVGGSSGTVSGKAAETLDSGASAPLFPDTEVPDTEVPDTDRPDIYTIDQADHCSENGSGNGFDKGSEKSASQNGHLVNGSGEQSSAIVLYPKRKLTAKTNLRNWGLLALLLLLIGGVLWRQPFVQTAWQGLDDASKTPAAPTGTGTGTHANTAIEPEADSETPEVAQAAATETNTVTAPGTPAVVNTVTTPGDEEATAQAMIAEAIAALEKRQYSEALIDLQQVPTSQRDSTFSSVLTQARAGAAQVEQTNASVLTEARTSIQPTQASQFTEAIAKASLIKEGEPSYEEAQEDIGNWSRIILDIAEGRATSGNLSGAIAAAKVMPYANSEYRKKAQDRIVFWQQRQRSRAMIAEARQIPVSGQASSYQQGIVKLREVPIEHPEYETAQRLADDWSQRIFSIAQARAAQDRRSAAIDAAILVPAGTTAYEPTQQAIKRWRLAE